MAGLSAPLTVPRLPRGGWAFAALFAGVFCLRLLLLLSSQNAVSGDEATVGILARHIAFQGERPVVAYGADYNGGAALTAYLAAGSFALFGMKELALKAIPFTYSVIALVAVYSFVKAARGPRAALLASLLYGTSVCLLKWNFDARGGYAECQVLIPLTLHLLRSRALPSSFPPWWAFLVGVLSGFGVYILQMFIPVGLTCFLLIVLHGTDRLRRLVAFAVGSTLGIVPLLAHGAPGGAVGLDPRPILGRLALFPGMALTTVGRLLPGLFSYDNFEAYPPLRLLPNGLEYLFLAAAIALILSRRGLWARSRGVPGEDPVPIEGVLFLYVALYLVLFALHPLATNSPRYLIFLEPALSILAGLGLTEALERRNPPPRFVRAAALVLLALLVGDRALQIERLSRDHRIYGPDGPSDPRTADAVIAFLDERNLPRVVTEDWDLGWRIAFKTGERIAILHNLNNLHQAPPFAAIVEPDSEDDRRVRTLLAKRGRGVERHLVGGKAVYPIEGGES
jgi:4-amino-4-deoxy-L-arabinose transferase-like glycosyltransferase